MPKKHQGQGKPKEQQEKRPATPTFLLELPLVVNPGQAARLRAHLEAARQLYNALLSQGQQRLRRMRADPAWQETRALPRSQKAERAVAFSALHKRYSFSEAALYEAVKGLHVGWIAEHIEAVLAQTLATRGLPRHWDLRWRPILIQQIPLPRVPQGYWEGSEARLRAAHERTAQRAKEGQNLPRSFGLARAGARLPESLGEPTQESAFLLRHGRREA